MPFGASHGYGYTRLIYIASKSLRNDIIAHNRRTLNSETFLRLPATMVKYSYGESKMANGTSSSKEQQPYPTSIRMQLRRLSAQKQ